MKVNYKMCKKCRIKNEPKYGWSDVAENWATGKSQQPPHICCPGNIVETYYNRLLKKLKNTLSVEEQKFFSLALNCMSVHNVFFIQKDNTPVWCPNEKE